MWTMTNGTDGNSKILKHITSMKKHSIYLLYTIILLATSACSNDFNEPDNKEGNSNASAVYVDYALNAEYMSTRAPGDVSRINSLHYLVYDVTDADTKPLVKKRQIPDIGADTQWPMTRENMTWAQREALQDTLPAGRDYKVMFVANADPKLFADGQSELLQNISDYKTAVLVMPTTAFDESNMYYFWSSDITSDQAQHDTPYMCIVKLQRIVTRTDVSCVQLPDKSNVTAYESFVKQVIQQSTYKQLESDIREQVSTTINKMQTKAGLAAGAGTIPIIYAGDLAEFNKALDNEDNVTAIAATLKEQIINALYDRIRNSAMLAEKTGNWNMGDNCLVDLQYKPGKRVTAFPLGNYSGLTTPVMDVLTTYANQGKFTFYALSAGEDATNQAAYNIIERLSLYSADNKVTPAIQIVGDWNTAQGKNTWKKAVCNPISEIIPLGTEKITVDCYADLTPFLPDSWTINTFEQTMITIILSPNGNQTYGDSFSHFKFSISLPALNEQNGGVLIKPSWTITDGK